MPGLPSLPTAPRFEIISASSSPTRDPWGNFPVLCPNGSGYSIRIGNQGTGTTADRVTYRFTIPPTQNTFSLIYNYAIVINNTGGHPEAIQPRLTVRVTNVTDNTVDNCSSFDIAYSNANPLPGFQSAASNSNIKFKPWAANSINLDGNAGKTIEISFTSTGCGATGGTHFGYAYLDVNAECSSSFVGATYCPDDAFINVTAPFGYQNYEWWNSTFTTVLGNTQTLNFTPPPPAGTQIAVVLDPFNGYGCKDTLYADLLDTLTVQAIAGPDEVSCQNAPVQLGAAPKATYLYSWTPPTGLSNPNIANPVATPSVTTQYILTVTTAGGGCASKDTVIVNAAVLDNSLRITGPTTGCIVGSQPTILEVNPADSVQWYHETIAIPGATQPQYTVTQPGNYYATVFSFAGCNLSTATTFIDVNPAPAVGFSANAISQCFAGNQFTFTNTSTVLTGTMQYNWDMGDGTTATTQDVTHSYTMAGTYIVRLIVTTDKGCIDSAKFTVNVNASPLAGFSVNADKQCFKNHQFVFTNSSTISSGTMQYLWDFGDSNSSTGRDVTHSYTLPGTYTVRLTVTSDKGCPDDSVFTVTVNEDPVAGFAAANPQQCFANHQFNFINSTTVTAGTLQYLWYMGDGNTATTRDVMAYSYAAPGNYTVKMVATTNEGCADSLASIVNIFAEPVAGFSVNADKQCFKNHQFVFNNTSTIASGTMQYHWDFGDASTAITRDATHSYALPGTYTVKLTLTSDNNCTDDSTFTVTVNESPVAGFAVANAQQCFTNNQFNFINSTTPGVGTLAYLWTLGDGNTATTRDVAHSYSTPGDYLVKMVASTPDGCADSTTTSVKIFDYPVADFYVTPVCVNLDLPLTNKTINRTGYPLNYLWDFGNGVTSNSTTPNYRYPAPGTYTFSLSVNTVQCPLTVNTKTISLVVDAPVAAVRYPDREIVMNYAERLEARQIGNSVLWNPATSLDSRTSYRPYFKGLDPQLYEITLKTATGCVTVDTQYVKTRKKIDIYVPASFTPNGDGLNDYLRPYALGFKQVNWFRVYNRWGKLLFQMQSDAPGWDGRTNGQVQETQTVIWMIEAVDVDGKVHKKQGTAILLH